MGFYHQIEWAFRLKFSHNPSLWISLLDRLFFAKITVTVHRNSPRIISAPVQFFKRHRMGKQMPFWAG
jgi:hypothetical protein